MRKLFVVFMLSLISVCTFAKDVVKSESANSELNILDLVVDIHQTYSKSSELNAKVIEILGGDGMNPTRMVLVLNSGYESKIFNLNQMMYKVDRITFNGIDSIVINYTQDDNGNLDDMDDSNDWETIQVKKSIEIKVKRNADKSLSDEIELSVLK